MRRLAIQTDTRGVTALLVETATGEATIVAATTVTRPSEPATLAASFRAAMPSLAVSKLEVVVALSPAEARVRRLTVPPVPPEETPVIVALQAAREAGLDNADIVADFLPAESRDDGACEVLVAWATADAIDYWRDFATHLGGRLTRATPRPLAAAGVGPSSPRLQVVATLAGDEVDFVAFAGGDPVLVRSARLTGEPLAAAERELRRTLLSLPATNRDVGTPLVLADWRSSNADGDQLLASTNPTLQYAPGCQALPSCAAAERLTVWSATGAPTLNLVDPRRPPAKQSGLRQKTLLAAAAAVLLLAAGWTLYGRLSAADRKVELLRKELAAATADAEAFDPYRDRVAELDGWLRSDVVWLDELNRLSAKLRPLPLEDTSFPVEDDLRATQFVATASPDRPGGRITLDALSRSPSTEGLEARLRDASHPVEPISTAETRSDDAYRYKYVAALRAPAATNDPPRDGDEQEDPS